MNTIWSDFVQTSAELNASRGLRFRADNKQLWLDAIGLRDGMNVLELGCGGGIFCQRVKEFLPQCSVTGVDLDSGHIAFAAACAAEAGLDCRFVQADATALPFADGSFDLCFSHTVIEHLPAEPFLREQLRVLKPGGRIAVLRCSTPHEMRNINDFLSAPQEKELFDKAWAGAEHFAPTRHIAAYPLRDEDFPRLLTECGFSRVSLEFFSSSDYCPDNATTPPERALAQIESTRLAALSSVEKARRIAPENLSAQEYETLAALIHARFDARLAQYQRGEKCWDFTAGVVLCATGHKRGGTTS